MFLPTTREEMDKLGWKQCDVILVTGDAYIDSPYVGVSVIGHVLMSAGYKVGVIGQPEIKQSQVAGFGSRGEHNGPGPGGQGPKNGSQGPGLRIQAETDTTPDILRLGEPLLFWGVSGGCVDSMVSNYTAVKKPRRSDDFTPGGQNTKRPDRAVIAYSNLIRQHFKNTVPIVLGGIEASLRRVAHYDYWNDNVRKSILFDAKADILVYGMGEKTVMEVAEYIRARVSGHKAQNTVADRQGFKPEIENDIGKTGPRAMQPGTTGIRGICYISRDPVPGYIEIPSYDEVKKDKAKFIESFKLFYNNNDPGTARGLMQKQDTRYLIQNPPQDYPSEAQMDSYNGLPYERDAHPYYSGQGPIKALETIKFSINSHRGCFGECNFCAITVHQGRVVTSRSEESVIEEAKLLTALPGFKGYIYDVGGPTANMYGMGCSKLKGGHCANKHCLFPEVCPNLYDSHERQIKLLERIRHIKGIKKVFIASGIRYDMVAADKKYGDRYLRDLVEHHVSGQIKLAPEHSEPGVLNLMGKPSTRTLKEFKDRYYMINKEKGLKQFLTYYLIAAHPGCTERDMNKLKSYVQDELKAHPEQVQIFTPTPGTWSGVMYYTETDPFTGAHVFVEKSQMGKERQKGIIQDTVSGSMFHVPKGGPGSGFRGLEGGRRPHGAVSKTGNKSRKNGWGRKGN
ncbi:MAG: YgiQ family radical SAM protein [Spirochaetia bacterium]|nr:YgiQ family radical SAM protein [Spirochaetia bacterium]